MTSVSQKNESTNVYIGTYTGKGSEGIYRFRLHHASGELTSETLAAKIKNPSWLTLSPDKRFLYCINEISDYHGQKSGAATSFSIDPKSLDLIQLDDKRSGGTGPCYASVTTDGNALLVANYGSGSIALLPAASVGGLEEPVSVVQHEGSSIVPKRQDGPHAHCIRPDPFGRYAVAVDLGIDEIISYRIAPDTGELETSAPVINKTDKGAGPRHIAFYPNGKTAYVSNELNSTLTSWNWDAETGELKIVQSISTIPADFKGENYPAEVLVSPDGKSVYLTNRGHNSIAVFRTLDNPAKLELVGFEPTHGHNPRGMAIDPTGRFLIVANQDSDNLVVFRISSSTGVPEFASEYKGINRPVAIVYF